MAFCSFDGASVVPSRCPGGASMVTRWCVGGVSAICMLIQSVPGVLVVSWWHNVGGVEAVVRVVGWLCLGGVSLRAAQILRVFWVGHTMHQGIATVPSCCHADNHDS